MKGIFLFVLCCLTPSLINAQVTFQRRAHINDSLSYHVILTKEKQDHHFLTMMRCNDYGYTSSQIHLFDRDSLGMITWYKRYYDPTVTTYVYGMDVLPSGLIAVAGEYYNDMLLATFSSSGDLLTATRYDLIYGSGFNDIIHTSASQFLICGTGNLPFRGELLKTDSTGNIIWSNEYQVDSNITTLNVIRNLSDGNPIVAGNVNMGPYIPAVYMKIDSAGTVLWSLIVANTNYSIYTRDMVELSDGSIIVVGNINIANQFVFMLKISATGQLIWSRSFKMPNQINVMNIIADVNGLVFAGNNYGNYTTYICRADTAGHFISAVEYEENNSLVPRGILRCEDKGYFITAMAPTGTGLIDQYALKTDSNLSSHCHMNSTTLVDSAFFVTTSTGINQFPVTLIPLIIPLSGFLDSAATPIETDACDPTGTTSKELSNQKLNVYELDGIFHFSFNSVSPEHYQLCLYDMSGRIVFDKSISASEGVNTLEVDSKNLSGGIYFCTLTGDSERFFLKVLKN